MLSGWPEPYTTLPDCSSSDNSYSQVLFTLHVIQLNTHVFRFFHVQSTVPGPEETDKLFGHQGAQNQKGALIPRGKHSPEEGTRFRGQCLSSQKRGWAQEPVLVPALPPVTCGSSQVTLPLGASAVDDRVAKVCF